MNGKQAKKLRRAALGLAATLTEAGRDIKKDGYTVKTHSNRFNDTQAEANTSPVSYQLLVRPDSVKSIYKNLKSGKM